MRSVATDAGHDAAQLERLLALGCPLGQGFLFGAPMDGEETIAHLLSRQADTS